MSVFRWNQFSADSFRFNNCVQFISYAMRFIYKTALKKTIISSSSSVQVSSNRVSAVKSIWPTIKCIQLSKPKGEIYIMNIFYLIYLFSTIWYMTCFSVSLSLWFVAETRTPTHTKVKFHTERSQSRTFLLWGDSIPTQTLGLPGYYLGSDWSQIHHWERHG